MKKNNTQDPSFSRDLLHPKYWGVWFSFGLLALTVNVLPYSVTYKLGCWLGRISMRVTPKRVAVAKRNLQLAFPDMSETEINAFVVKNFENTGFAIFETGIAWFWPNWRFKRLVSEKSIAPLKDLQANKKGVLLVCIHQLNLEIAGRALACAGIPGNGIYRPHSNPAYDFIQFWGRTNYGNGAVNRRNLKKMIRLLRQGAIIMYLPDHDYGHNQSVFVPFFAVEESCTTTGTSILAYTSKCELMPYTALRNENGQYEMVGDQVITSDYPQDDPEAAAAYTNRYVEESILLAPEQWMWVHKRFKSRPDHTQTNSLYN